jgi:hypothetical protein
MSDAHIRVRANKHTGELEVEGPAEMVKEWWEKLWPSLNEAGRSSTAISGQPRSQAPSNGNFPDVFGEFYHEFRSDITDVDRVLIAAVFIQSKDSDKVFTTKNANQALLDQNVKVANASEAVRRLVNMKRAFVVSDGKFRVSSTGFDHLNSLKPSSQVNQSA